MPHVPQNMPWTSESHDGEGGPPPPPHRRREAGLAALVDTARELALPYELDTLLGVITRRARLLLDVSMSWVTFHQDGDAPSVVRAADGHASAITVGFLVPRLGGVGNEATSRSAPFWSPDYLNDHRFAHSTQIDDVVRAEGLQALVAIPLRGVAGTIGVLYAADRTVRHFAPEEVTLLSSLGDLASVAIEKTQLMEQIQAKVTELEGSAARAVDSSSADRQLREIQRRLIDVVLHGRGLHALVNEAAEELGGALQVRDPANRSLALAGELPDLDEPALTQAALDAHTQRRPIRSGKDLWLHPISAGPEILGTLFLHTAEPSTAQQVELLAPVAQVVATQMLMQHGAAAAEGQVREDLFKDLLNPRQTAQQLAERAQRIGLDLGQPHVVVVARPESRLPGRAVIWASSYAHRMAGLKYVDGGCLAFLLPGSDAETAGQTVSRELGSVLEQPVTAGVAGPVAGAGAVRSAYDEARRCLDVLAALGSVGSTASARQLGFLGVLLSEDHDIPGYIDAALGPVLDYDAQQGTELLRTLQEYLIAGNSPTQAAKALHVHPNTVARRLERIGQLLGADWQEPVKSLEIHLALRLHRTRQALRPPR
jgi:sugar diacid utilization regulator